MTVTRPGVPDWSRLDVSVAVLRDGATVFEGTTSTARMRRTVGGIREQLADARKQKKLVHRLLQHLAGTGPKRRQAPETSP